MKRNRLKTGLAAAGLAVGLLTLGGGTASAEPVSAGQQYGCTFPVFSNDPVGLSLSTDLPNSMRVGDTVHKRDIKPTLRLSRNLAQGMNVLGGATIEGKATLNIRVSQPGGPDVHSGIAFRFPGRDLPEPAADFDITDLVGIDPEKLVTWDRPGTAEFHALGLKLHEVTVRDADGNPDEELGPLSSAR